jgi:hypothetical protein
MTHNQGPEASSSSLSDLLEEKNLRTKAVEALERGLEATSRFYDVINDTFIDVPDHRIRLAAAMAALAYTDGRPVERRELITRNVSTLEDLRAKAKQSPELRAAIEELLRDMEKPIESQFAAQAPEHNKDAV